MTLCCHIGDVAYDYLLREMSTATSGEFIDARTQTADISLIVRVITAHRFGGNLGVRAASCEALAD